MIIQGENTDFYYSGRDGQPLKNLQQCANIVNWIHNLKEFSGN